MIKFNCTISPDCLSVVADDKELYFLKPPRNNVVHRFYSRKNIKSSWHIAIRHILFIQRTNKLRTPAETFKCENQIEGMLYNKGIL